MLRTNSSHPCIFDLKLVILDSMIEGRIYLFGLKIEYCDGTHIDPILALHTGHVAFVCRVRLHVGLVKVHFCMHSWQNTWLHGKLHKIDMFSKQIEHSILIDKKWSVWCKIYSFFFILFVALFSENKELKKMIKTSSSLLKSNNQYGQTIRFDSDLDSQRIQCGL